MGVVVHFHVRSNTINDQLIEYIRACAIYDAGHHKSVYVRRSAARAVAHSRPLVCANDRCRLGLYHDGPCDDSAVDSA